MTTYLDATYLDRGVTWMRSGIDGDSIYLCNAMPSNYTEASSTFAVGQKSSVVAVKEYNPGGGLRARVSPFSDGSITQTGTASHYAWTAGNVLILARDLPSPFSVTLGETWGFDTPNFYAIAAPPAGSFLDNLVFDQGIWKVHNDMSATSVNRGEVHICSQLPQTYDEAVSFSLGGADVSTGSFPAIEDDPSGGRRLRTETVSGTVSANGIASHYAWINPFDSLIYGAAPLDAAKEVFNGDGFGLTIHYMVFPLPA